MTYVMLGYVMLTYVMLGYVNLTYVMLGYVKLTNVPVIKTALLCNFMTLCYIMTSILVDAKAARLHRALADRP